MQILFLTQVLPYPIDAGPKMRNYYVLRYLAERHQVTLVSFVRENDRPESLAHLADLCHDVHWVPMKRNRLRDLQFAVQSVVGQEPFLINRDIVPEMVTCLERLTAENKFDVIHADQLWMARYALMAAEKLPEARLVLDQHNAVFMIPARMAETENRMVVRRFLAHEAKLLKRFEVDVCRRFDQVVWVTDEDFKAVSDLLEVGERPLAPETIIPICLDPNDNQMIDRPAGQMRVTFLGGLHWPPNAAGMIWFAREVWPQITANIPGAILTIIGKNPPRELVQLAESSAQVEVTGYVDDPAPYLAETGVFVVPLHAGGGMRVKVIEAWAWGLPMVSTTIGAEGIRYNDGEDIFIADDPPSFAEAVIRLLKDPAEAARLTAAGRETVKRHYDWRQTYRAWDRVYEAGVLEAV